MPGCSAKYCTNSLVKGYQMCRIPWNKKRREMWLKYLNRPNWEPGPNCCLCEAHFEDNMWEKTRDGKRRLKSSAVPTIFNYSQEVNEYEVHPANVISITLTSIANAPDIHNNNNKDNISKPSASSVIDMNIAVAEETSGAKSIGSHELIKPQTPKTEISMPCKDSSICDENVSSFAQKDEFCDVAKTCNLSKGQDEEVSIQSIMLRLIKLEKMYKSSERIRLKYKVALCQVQKRIRRLENQLQAVTKKTRLKSKRVIRMHLKNFESI